MVSGCISLFIWDATPLDSRCRNRVNHRSDQLPYPGNHTPETSSCSLETVAANFEFSGTLVRAQDEEKKNGVLVKDSISI